MSRNLDDLSPRFRPLAFEFLARCVEQGIPVCIVGTGRTPAEHAANLAKGVSWTQHSKHLDGDAIDVCPYSEWHTNGPDKLAWDASSPLWAKLAMIGRSVGLRCGYDWKQKDLGHFEYVEYPPTHTA